LRGIEKREEEGKEKMYERDWKTGHFSRGEILKEGIMSRSKNIDLVFSLFSFSFYFPFNLFFIFLFLELWG